MNYTDLKVYQNGKEIFKKLHELPWNKNHQLSENFNFYKIATTIQEFETEQLFDLVYFDAFAPNKQPELWEIPIFEKVFHLMNTGGILVTYCAKGQVRRNMQAAGFEVERLEGPPGKREMLKATKK